MKHFVWAILFFAAPLVFGSSRSSETSNCRTLLKGMAFAVPNAILESLRNDELYLPAYDPGSQVRGLVETHLSGGKRYRPTAVYLSSLAMGISSSMVEKLAGYVELIHLGSLPLDDIIDKATERRGRPTMHVAVGPTKAITTGPYLQASVLDDCEEHTNSAVRRAINRTLKVMVDAENLQDDLKKRAASGGSYSRVEYEKVAMGKTGYLFGLSLAISSLHFEKSPELVNDWLALGYKLGFAYQVKDDFSDALNEPTEVNFALLLFSLNRGGSPFRQLTADENAELRQWQESEQAGRREEMEAIFASIKERIGAPKSPDQQAALETLRDMIEYVTSP
jgi:geranylgeranyl pyrophosphate synthase